MASTPTVLWTGLGTRESYLRCVALAVFVYDFLLTIPAEYRFYRRQKRFKPSFNCLLFALCRYSTLIGLTGAVMTYLMTDIPPSSCSHIVKFLSACQVLTQTSASGIFAYRAVVVWPNRWVYALVGLTLAAATGLGLFEVSRSVPYALPGIENCISSVNAHLPFWMGFFLYIIFDLVVFLVLFVRLVQQNSFDQWSQLPRIMLRDGLLYLLGSMAFNIANAVLFSTPPQEGLITLVDLVGCAFLAIFAQRAVLGLQERSQKRELAQLPVIAQEADKAGVKGARQPLVIPLLLRRETKVTFEPSDGFVTPSPVDTPVEEKQYAHLG